MDDKERRAVMKACGVLSMLSQGIVPENIKGQVEDALDTLGEVLAAPSRLDAVLARYPHLAGESISRATVADPQHPLHKPSECAQLGGRCGWNE